MFLDRTIEYPEEECHLPSEEGGTYLTNHLKVGSTSKYSFDIQSEDGYDVLLVNRTYIVEKTKLVSYSIFFFLMLGEITVFKFQNCIYEKGTNRL